MGKIRNFCQIISETKEAIVVVVIAVGVVAMVWSVFWDWLMEQSIQSRILFSVAILLFLIIPITFFIDWWYKRDIKSLPKQLASLNTMTMTFLETYDLPSEKMTDEILDELASISNLRIAQLKAAAHQKDKKRAQNELATLTEKYRTMVKPRDTKSTALRDYLLMGEVLNDHGIGLSNFTSGERYQKQYRRIRSLQEQLSSVEASSRVNDYLVASEAYYHMLLSTKTLSEAGEFAEIIPAKFKAETKLLRVVVENEIASLITSVRESMLDVKEQKNGTHQEKRKK